MTGQGLDKLKEFLGHLNSRIHISGLFQSPSDPIEFYIDGIYQVTGVGLVVAGTLKAGTIESNTILNLGPDKTGNFKPVMVKTIHHKMLPVEKAFAGQAVCFAIKSMVKKDNLRRNNFRKGMIMLDKDVEPTSIQNFEAEVKILHHATTIKPNYQAVIHCGVIRQCAQVLEMNKDLMRTGDTGFIKFRFMYRPEYLKVGTTILFREGRTKGLGLVSRIFPNE